MYEPLHRSLMVDGVGRVARQAARAMPYVGGEIQVWMNSLAASQAPADYFMHPLAFPLMLLPWWAERQWSGSPDTSFQTDLIYSNACLYYYIRLVDNLMDRHATVELQLLPAAGYFVSQFQSAYYPYFAQPHPFWDFFAATWSEFCDVTAHDGRLTDVDEATFTRLVGRKVCAAKISVAAVCHRYHHPEAIPLWSEWIDRFGCWHLLEEDLFDWNQDLKLGAATYFLSEARRRKASGELEVTWMAREGLEWVLAQLHWLMRELRQMTFVPEQVPAYLDERERLLAEHREAISSALLLVRQLTESANHD